MKTIASLCRNVAIGFNAAAPDGLFELIAPGAISRAVTGEILTTPEEIRAEMAGRG